MPDAEYNLTPADKVALAEVLDRIVPPVDDLEGAGGLGLVQSVDEISRRIARWRNGLLLVAEAVSLDPTARAAGGWTALDVDEQVASLKVIEDSLPAHFSNFVEAVYAAYYSDSRVHERIGWRSGAPQPSGWELPPWDPAVLETARKREPFWREAPESQRS